MLTDTALAFRKQQLCPAGTLPNSNEYGGSRAPRRSSANHSFAVARGGAHEMRFATHIRRGELREQPCVDALQNLVDDRDRRVELQLNPFNALRIKRECRLAV